MRKSLECMLLAAILIAANSGAQATIYNVTGLFKMFNPSGSQIGVDDPFVNGTYNDAVPTSMALASPQPFQGLLWTANGGSVETAPNTYTFEACLSDGSSFCSPPAPISMTVGANQWGGHLLFNWGSSVNIDVLNVWDVVNNLDGSISLNSTDPEGDGIFGIPMVDGPFKGFSVSYDLTLTAVPVPAAVWLFVSGLLGLVGMARRKKAA